MKIGFKALFILSFIVSVLGVLYYYSGPNMSPSSCPIVGVACGPVPLPSSGFYPLSVINSTCNVTGLFVEMKIAKNATSFNNITIINATTINISNFPKWDFPGWPHTQLDCTTACQARGVFTPSKTIVFNFTRSGTETCGGPSLFFSGFYVWYSYKIGGASVLNYTLGYVSSVEG